jgi:polysaccharide export outer membrane protein
MTKSALNEYLVSELYPKHVKVEPIITIRFANFKITIIGEEGSSGNFSVSNERLSIFEAIAMAGGLSLHARRDNVLLIRETLEGKKTFRIDLRDKNLLQSPYYWLQQNDVLYFHADPQSARSTYFGQIENMFLGILSAAMSTASFTLSMINYARTQRESKE